jgi:hypothetical protein
MKVKLIQTSSGCPEQYNGYINDECVAYLRLRHGYFRVEYKDEVVYTARPNGDGIFEDDERDKYLEEACQAILKAHYKGKVGNSYYIVEEDKETKE